MGLSPFVVFDRVATKTSNSGSDFFDVLLGDSVPQDSYFVKWQWRDWDRVHSNFWSVLPSVVLQGTPITLLMTSLSHLLCGSNLLISHTLNTPSAFTMKLSTLSFRISSQLPNLYLGIHCAWDLRRLASPTLSHQMRLMFVSVSCHAVFEWRLPLTASLTSAQDTSYSSANHCRIGDSSLIGSCVLHSM